MLLKEGSLLKNRYEILEKIGGGGFGDVYLVEDKLKNSRFALKETICDDTEVGDPEKIKEQFLFEAKILVQLSHPQLPAVEDFFGEENRYYLVMEYIDGEDLHNILKQNPSIPESQILDWAIQLCNVLEYLHSQTPQPVIFRDLKPKNIMLSKNGQIKLIDFGISKLLDRGTETKTAAKAASQHYSPPEQYTSAGTDKSSDIYSLGATLYFLLTRYPPVDSLDRLTNTLTIAKPSSLNPSISPELEKIILKAMELDKKKRFPSVDAFREALIKLIPEEGNLPASPELSGKLITTVRQKYSPSKGSKELAEKERKRKRGLIYKKLFLWSGVCFSALILLWFLLNPFIVKFTLEQAKRDYKLGDYNSALVWLERACLAGGKNPEIYFALGQVYFQKKDYSAAIKMFQKLPELDPECEEAYYMTGKSYFLLGDYREAEKILLDYHTKHKSDYRASLALSGTYLSLKEWENAFLLLMNDMAGLKYDYTPATAYNGWIKEEDKRTSLAGYYCNLGKSYELQKNYKMALRQYESAGKVQPENLKFKECVSSIIETLQSSSDYSRETTLLLGNAYLLIEEYKKAIDEYETLADITEFKSDAYFLMHLGQAYYGKGDTQKAVKNFSMAMDVISENPDSYKELSLTIPFDDNISMENSSGEKEQKSSLNDKMPSSQTVHEVAEVSSSDSKLEAAPENEVASETGSRGFEKKDVPLQTCDAELYYYTGQAYEKEGDIPQAIKQYELYQNLCPRGVFRVDAGNKILKLKESSK